MGAFLHRQARLKLIHYTSVLVYVGTLWHGLMLDPDAREPWLLAIYLLTSAAATPPTNP